MEQEMVDARGSMSLQLSEYLEVPEPPEPLTPRRWQRLERFGEISIGSVGAVMIPHSTLDAAS
eukprot:4756121-Amphidinium_carterae.2